MEEDQIPEGHVGNLTDEQQKILNEIKNFLKKNDQLRPIYDDWTLLRFCRARKFVYDDVMEMIQNNIRYYTEFNVWQYIKNDYSELDDINARYQEYFGTVDKKGRPTYIMIKGKHEADPEVYSKFQDNFFHEHDLLMLEYYMRGVLPYCSYLAKKRIDTCVMIGDLKNVSLSNIKSIMDNDKLKKLMKDIGKIRNDNYPEVLGEYYIINAPLWFRGIWTMGKYMIDKKTRKKIHIYGVNWKKVLKEVIDEDKLPKEYGGTVEVDWSDLKRSDGPWFGYCEYMEKKQTFFPQGEEYGDPIYGVEKFQFTDEQLAHFNRKDRNSEQKSKKAPEKFVEEGLDEKL